HAPLLSYTLSLHDALPISSSCINSFPLIFFAGPHPLSTVVSYRYKNHSRAGATFPHSARSWHNVSPLDATLMAPSRMCCKQRTYAIYKFFKYNIYKKQSEWGLVFV